MVDNLVEAFAAAKGFEPSSFTFSTYPARSNEEPGEITRSFHYYPDSSFSYVDVHGNPAWLREIGGRLKRAGYEQTLKHSDGDGADFRRWLYGARQYAAELKFLRQIAETGSVVRTTERAIARKVNLRRRGLRDWFAALKAVRAADLPWEGFAMGFGRQTECRPFGSETLTLDVKAIVFSRSLSAVTGQIAVRVFNSLDPAKKLSRKSAGDLNRALRHFDFQKERVIDGLFVMTKPVRRTTEAVRECTRIVETLGVSN